MQTYAVIQIGGKQFVVQQGDEIVVERLEQEANASIQIPVLMTFNADASQVEMGAPELTSKATAEVMEHMKGEKLRIAKFKAKVRYRKVTGFRPQLTKIKITKI